MKERPILFSGPMVRAILEGRKTQTRRIIKPQPYQNHSPLASGAWEFVTRPKVKDDTIGWFRDIAEIARFCPYGKPGDRLWVRETWGITAKVSTDCWDRLPFVKIPRDFIDYRATEPDVNSHWKPSIHMPRRFSRITLEITNVRVERLQDISEEDALAEGFDMDTCETVFDKAAGKHQVKQTRWVESINQGEVLGDYCIDCAYRLVAKRKDHQVCGWDDWPETDGPAYCEECGSAIQLSLTKYGIEREIWLENDDPEDRPRWPVRGRDARIVHALAYGIGDVQSKHEKRLAQIGFATAWNLINGKKHPWSSNPWVWVIEFKKI